MNFECKIFFQTKVLNIFYKGINIYFCEKECKYNC